MSILALFAATCAGVDVDNQGFCTGLPSPDASSGNLQSITQVVLGILAVAAVLIIVIAALNIVTSGGDSSKIAKARGTILYALVGLVIAVSAEVIVSLVLGKL